jgi:hypothetical protein
MVPKIVLKFEHKCLQRVPNIKKNFSLRSLFVCVCVCVRVCERDRARVCGNVLCSIEEESAGEGGAGEWRHLLQQQHVCKRE